MMKKWLRQLEHNGPLLYVWIALLLVAGLVAAPLVAVPAVAQSSLDMGKTAVAGLDGALLMDQPDGSPLQKLAAGEVVTAIGRTPDSQFLWVVTDRQVEGWIQASQLVIFGAASLPVIGGDAATAAASPTTPSTKNTPLVTATPAATATPTVPPTPTVTPTPTVPPTPTVTPTPTVPPTPIPTSDAIGVTLGEGALLYKTPEGERSQELPGAEAVNVLGRTTDATWLLVETFDGKQGWLPAEQLVTFGIEELPDLSGQPATDPSAAAAVAPATPTVVAAEETSMISAASGAAEEQRVVASGAVTTIDTRLNIRSGPASSSPIVGKAASEEPLAVAARSSDNLWLLIVRADLPAGAGWVAAELVTLEGAVGDLPVATDTFEDTAAQEAPANWLPTATAEAAMPAPRQASTGLDGTLVFQDGRGALYVYDLARGSVRYLTSGFDPDISRDGSKVTFVRDGVYTIQIDGTGERLLHRSELVTSPKWSPDGQYVLFSRLLGEYKCWDTEFFGCVSVKELSGRFPGAPPAILQSIFLSGYDRISLPNFGLSRVDADGKEFRDVAALDSAMAPDWSDGGIVYQSKAGLEVTDDTADADTRSVQNAHWDWDPDWAPDGGRIVYQSKEGPHWEIFSISPDGSGVFALTRPVTTLVDELPSNVAPAFSPTGQQIVYLSNRDEENDAGPWRLWVMAADGSNQRPLPIEIEISYGYGGEQVVSWGP